MQLSGDDNRPLGRRERKRIATEDMLAEIAFGLFELHGYESVTMDQIASAADVARGTLYNHFPVKEALLDHYFKMEYRTGVEELLGAVITAQGLRAQLAALFDAFSVWASARRKYLPYALEYGIKVKASVDGAMPRSDLQNLFSSLFTSAQTSGELPITAEPDYLASNLELMYFGAIVRWLASAEESPRDECRRTLALFLEGAFSTSAGEQK